MYVSAIGLINYPCYFENMKWLIVFSKFCELAQLVEQLTVNQFVIGSSPIFAVKLNIMFNLFFHQVSEVPPKKVISADMVSIG